MVSVPRPAVSPPATTAHSPCCPTTSRPRARQAFARDVLNVAEEMQLRRPFSGWAIRLASLAGRLCLSLGLELELHAPFEYAMVFWYVGRRSAKETGGEGVGAAVCFRAHRRLCLRARYIEYIESWNSTVQSAAFKGQLAHNEYAVRQAKRKKGKAKPKKKNLARVSCSGAPAVAAQWAAALRSRVPPRFFFSSFPFLTMSPLPLAPAADAVGRVAHWRCLPQPLTRLPAGAACPFRLAPAPCP